LLRRLRRDDAFSRAATFGDFLGRCHEKFIHLPANLVVRYLNAGAAPSARRAGRMESARDQEYSICRSAMGINPSNRRIGDIF
jgi:hypothetical protein